MTATLPQAPPKKRTQGPRAVKFIETCCIHPEGDLVGQPLILHSWWKQRLYELLELLPRECALCGALESFAPARDQTARRVGWEDAEAWICTTCQAILESLPPDLRRYSEAYISTGAKSAKTTVMAGLSLYLTAADNDPGALVICAAESEGQSSNLLYGFAKYMCETSAILKEITEPFNNEILVKGTRSRMRNVSGAVGTNDGPVTKALLCEELHEWKGQRGRDRFAVLAKGCVRTNALIVAVTTAGWDEDSICFDRYSYGRKVQSGEVEDPRFYFHCREAPEGCDHRDPKMWAIANPLLGVTPSETYMLDRIARTPEGPVRRYNLNQWTAGEEIWIPHGVWDLGLRPDLDLDPAKPLYVGIDIAKTIDSSALAMGQDTGLTTRATIVNPDTGEQTEEEVPLYVVRVKLWENPYPSTHSLHASWRMNNAWVTDLCKRLFERFREPAAEVIEGKDHRIMPGPAFCFDPWHLRTEAVMLTGEGLNMIEVQQTDTNMVPASQSLYEHIVRGQFAHEDDPALKRHIYGVTADPTHRGWRIAKPHGSPRKIDGAVGLAMMLLQMLKGAPVVTKARVSWV